MKAKPFEPMIADWSAKFEWNPEELNTAAKLLLAISKANAGEIAPDVALDAETSDDFALQRAQDALARRVAPYAKMLREKLLSPRFSKPLEVQTEHVVPELVSHEWDDCIDINTDDADLLWKLPGISRDLALQIIKYRKKNGPFSALEQLSNIDEMGPDIVEALKGQSYFGTTAQTVTMTHELATFIREPTFKHYVELIAGTKDALALSISESEDPKLQVLAELKKTLEDVEEHKYGIAKNLRYTRASRVLIERRRRERAQQINENETRAVDCGALLYDGQYSEFLSKLIEQAKKSIYVMMFFMKYEEGKDYVTNPLVEALIKARVSDLDVKIILDKDAEDDVAKSRLVNGPAFEVLKQNDVLVMYDPEDRMTHSKLVVVDGKHVVVGSHNWTAGSFLAYDDTSIYIESEELAQKYHTIFNGLWDEYKQKEMPPIS